MQTGTLKLNNLVAMEDFWIIYLFHIAVFIQHSLQGQSDDGANTNCEKPDRRSGQR